MNRPVKRLWTVVDDDLFYQFIHRAQAERLFTSDNGVVDIGALLHKLVVDFANGSCPNLSSEKVKKKGLFKRGK